MSEGIQLCLAGALCGIKRFVDLEGIQSRQTTAVEIRGITSSGLGCVGAWGKWWGVGWVGGGSDGEWGGGSGREWGVWVGGY